MTKMGYRQGAHRCASRISRCCCRYCYWRTQHAYAGRSFHRWPPRSLRTPPSDQLAWPGPRKGTYKSANKLFVKLKIWLIMSWGQAAYRRARWRGGGGSRGAQSLAQLAIVELCLSWPWLTTLNALPLPSVVVPLSGIVNVGPALRHLPSQGL
jgi:hypothetical protein